MATYAIINIENVPINLIEWDGVTEYAPPSNCTLRIATPDDIDTFTNG